MHDFSFLKVRLNCSGRVDGRMSSSIPVVRQGVLAYAKQPCMNLGGGCLLAVVAASIQAGRREAGVAGTTGRPLGINPTPLYSLFFP